MSMHPATLSVPASSRSASWVQRRVAVALLFILVTTGALGLTLHRLGQPSNLTDIQNLFVLENPDLIPTDSWDPMIAALGWLHEHPGENVYDGVFFQQHIKFQYPVTSLLPLEAMRAAGLLTLHAFSRINLLLVMATAAGMAILMLELAARLKLPGARDDRTTQFLLGGLGFTATLCFYPVLKAFSLGQVQVWLNAAFVFACVALLRDRRALCGALLGASTLMKPQMSLFLVWAVVRGDWRMAAGWAAVVVPGVVLAALLYGIAPLVDYLDVLLFIGRHGESYYVNQTVNGLVNRLLHNGNNLDWSAESFAPYHPVVHAATQVSGLFFVLLGLLWRRREVGSERIGAFVFAGVCFTVGSPVAWVHHFGVLLPAFALGFLGLMESGVRRPAAAVAILCVAYFLAGNLLFWPVNRMADTPLNVLQSYLFAATLLLLGLLYDLAGRHDRAAVPLRAAPAAEAEPVLTATAIAPPAASGAEPPLFVDLDGTLLKTDLLYESLFGLIKAQPWTALLVPLWLAGGRARLKGELARRVEIDPASLVYNPAVLERLERERHRGRRLVLATAAHHRYADAIARHLGLFDQVLASNDALNLKSERKFEAIRAQAPSGVFDYMGNDEADFAIWRAARHGIAVEAAPAVIRHAGTLCPLETISTPRRSRPLLILRALRVHQWLKNLLVFVPLLAGQKLGDPEATLRAVLAFVAFGLCASSIYVLNDLLDLPADRRHPRKRRRPFASGDLPLDLGLLLIPALLAASAALSILALPPLFLAALAAYAASSLFYNLFAKNRVVWDVMLLAGLYSLRVLGGATATAIVPSFWLLAFSMFLFLSLAMVKRYSEMDSMMKLGLEQAEGRGYLTADMPVLQSIGVSSGFLSVLVMALYINSPEVGMVYDRPQALWIICPLLLFWIGRVWLQTHRGQMHDDPVVFAARDKWSIVIGVICAVVLEVGRT
ncbi:UbiA family prenyltransferase [Azospirillum picis]|uniref:4-hydroxybenzoate polyprenyltransferase/phosphoserine phosphatase n=1 Tax=Azospirillum picis TaxID=488438 RepID=A0ABU0MI65_9PROT|nr:UbiA family prenyltransferase [Azospirillum picis]MBP2299254.1 4-hydroxybenzoate polyprenyltransferase/phosphoserine phosphatase [Azospirillum picis]MDQ0533108.1 4-hydroxybenzoate polyprenyltransferase/phosphoserine phosphatase [Azospirillum picis]